MRDTALFNGQRSKLTDYEIEFIKRYFNKWPVEKLSKIMCRPVTTIRRHAYDMGLADRKVFGIQDLRKLESSIDSYTVTELSEMLGFTKNTIYKHIRHIKNERERVE